MSNVKTTDISSMPREKVVTLIASYREDVSNLRYTYEKECQRRQRIHERLTDIMGSTEAFTFDARDFARSYPFVTRWEKERVIGVIEDVVRTIGNAEYNKRRVKCTSLNAEYQACKKFCASLRDAIKTLESNIQILKERLVELDKA